MKLGQNNQFFYDEKVRRRKLERLFERFDCSRRPFRSLTDKGSSKCAVFTAEMLEVERRRTSERGGLGATTSAQEIALGKLRSSRSERRTRTASTSAEHWTNGSCRSKCVSKHCKGSPKISGGGKFHCPRLCRPWSSWHTWCRARGQANGQSFCSRCWCSCDVWNRSGSTAQPNNRKFCSSGLDSQHSKRARAFTCCSTHGRRCHEPKKWSYGSWRSSR